MGKDRCRNTSWQGNRSGAFQCDQYSPTIVKSKKFTTTIPDTGSLKDEKVQRCLGEL
jgi:hypothetical protein